MLDIKAFLFSFISVITTVISPAEKIPLVIPHLPPSNSSSSPIIDQLKSPQPSVKNLTYENIFSSDHAQFEYLPKNETIMLITTGDVIPARTVNWTMSRYNDFTYPFQKTADFLRSGDLALINLEAPLIPQCPVTNEGMVFCGNQRFLEGLRFAGIDVANLANNHTDNWGSEGLCQTVNLLSQNHILATGYPPNLSCLQSSSFPSFLPAVVPSEVEGTKAGPSLAIKGLKIGFLGFNLLDQFDKLDQLVQSVAAAKKEVDFLIVSLHWGAEYQRLPTQETVNLAHQMIDAGTDLIVGNHPHWYQPLEIYKNKLIIYAHGNFIFDQEWSRETKTGFIAKHTIYQGKLIDTQIFPIFIVNYSQPYLLEGKEKTEVLKTLEEISTNFSINN